MPVDLRPFTPPPLPPTATMATVSLPSIHEMFPEHLLRVAPEARVKGSAPPSLIPPHRLERPRQQQGYSFGVLRSDPASSSLTHIASSATLPYQPAATDAAGRATASVISDGEDDGIGLGKKHVCKTCNKRFNRPSSLRIHINTHTGATPFTCPFPGCGREFNVNSNMRRHYRNHTNPGAASLFPGSSGSNSGANSRSSRPPQPSDEEDDEEDEAEEVPRFRLQAAVFPRYEDERLRERVGRRYDYDFNEEDAQMARRERMSVSNVREERDYTRVRYR